MAERMAGKSSRRRIPESEAVEREFSPEPVARSAIAVKNLLVLDPESDRKQLKEEREMVRHRELEALSCRLIKERQGALHAELAEHAESVRFDRAAA